MIKRISCDCKCKFSSTACNSNQKWNNKIGQYECKNYLKCKKLLLFAIIMQSIGQNKKDIDVLTI